MNSRVPALKYPIDFAAFTAVSPSSDASSLARPGAGASSTTFWKRRCIEHSRSKKWTMFPCLSPSTWISMCRGRRTSFSTRTRSLPKAAFASIFASSRADANSSGACAARMPLPPPPSTGLISTGKPIRSASDRRRSALCSDPLYPGTMARPAAAIADFAASLLAILRMASGGGPMNSSPASRTASAKSAFSERKP